MTTTPEPTKNPQGGAVEGNVNALRHGLYSAKANELTSPYAKRRADEFRRAIERATLDAHGEIGVTAAAYIHTATEAMRVALANREMLARLEASAKPPDADLRLRFDAEYLKALDRRDAKLKALDLDRPTADSDPWRSIYAPLDVTEHAAQEGPENATGEQPAQNAKEARPQ